MGKIAKLFDIMKNCKDLFGMPATKAFDDLEIMNRGRWTEYYIDPRTKKNDEGVYVVKPVTESASYFAYVCPYCQDFHIESKSELVHDHQKLMCGCRHLKGLGLKYIIDLPASHGAIVLKEAREDGVVDAIDMYNEEKYFVDAFEDEAANRIASRNKIPWKGVI